VSAVKIAYIVSAYKYPCQLIRLIHALNTPNAIFMVHVDKKTHFNDYRAMVDGVDTLPNVTFLRRHKCFWGEFDHVLATLRGIESLIENSVDCDYVILLTGQDYPIKPPVHIERYLDLHRGKEFIEYRPITFNRQARRGAPTPDERVAFYIENRHLRVLGRHFWVPRATTPFEWSAKRFFDIIARVVINGEFPRGYQPFAGSSYWCLTRECVTYLNAFVREHPDFVAFFKHLFIPDEMFFQTIILNSPFKNKVVNENLRCIDWSRSGSNPRIWCKEDIEILKRSNGLIARKFDHTVDGEIIDLIDAELLSHAPSSCETISGCGRL
jgi:hypothetical protein